MENKFEQLIEFIINDEDEKAKELFHEVVVEKSREIYENLMAEDEVAEEEVIEEVVAEDDIMKEEIKEEMAKPKKTVKTKTEMEESYFSAFETRLSAIEKANEDLKALNVELSAENEELKKQLAESPAEHTKFNPEAEAQRDIKFKIGARREETITDRVFNSLF